MVCGLFLYLAACHAFPPYARCYAPDMIGMGLSSKPNIGYQICDRAFYLETLFNQLALDDITLVMHGWGSVLGLILQCAILSAFVVWLFMRASSCSLGLGDVILQYSNCLV